MISERRACFVTHAMMRLATATAGNARVFFHYITIGHSRDVIANCAMQPLLLDSSHRAFAQPIGIGKVRFKNAPQHLASALVHLRDARMIINILIQKFPQRSIRFEPIHRCNE